MGITTEQSKLGNIYEDQVKDMFKCVFRDDGYKFLNVKFENMKVLVEYPKEDFRRMDKKTGVVRNEDKKKLRFRIPDEMYVAMKLRMEPEILRLKLYPIDTARDLSDKRKTFLESLDPEQVEDLASFT